MRIALVEDDHSQNELVKIWLEKAGHHCKCFFDGKSFMRDIIHETYDLVILDWQLPDVGGDEILKWMRAELDSYTPVLFVTGRQSEEDIVHGLNCGADDYMTKPVRKGEMLARINALVRRNTSNIDKDNKFEVAEFDFDLMKKVLKKNGEEIELTHKEFDLSLFLFRNIGRILSRGHILESIWGKSSELKTRTVDTHVSRIRSKLDLSKESGWNLSSIYQHGYRLERNDNNVE
ncbi:MAG: response regulator transcription factor [Gammaproteobacteria bacterium]|nr:response regulator transcription factor [Gammaproteobacteria bacterium]